MNIKDTLKMWDVCPTTIPFSGDALAEHEEMLLKCWRKRDYVLLASLTNDDDDDV